VRKESIPSYISALCREAELRAGYLNGGKVSTVYFGGGTPSVLDYRQVEKVLNTVKNNFSCSASTEYTIECNPEHCTPQYLHELKSLGFNRISIGVQSLYDKELTLLHRRHTGAEAACAVENAVLAGFSNCNSDIIFGLPGQSMRNVGYTVRTIAAMGVTHISAYALTVHEKTALAKLIDRGRVHAPSHRRQAFHFDQTFELMHSLGYTRYEVSNYAKPGFESRHNSGYWSGAHYLGLGSSAHSYNGFSRQCNCTDVREYIKKLSYVPENGNADGLFQMEMITPEMALIEKIALGLRTSRGLQCAELMQLMTSAQYDSFAAQAKILEAQGFLTISDEAVILTPKGMLYADKAAEVLLGGVK